jgi:hypothetical protein
MSSEPEEIITEVQSNGLLDRTTALVKKFNLYLATLATMAGSWYALHKAAEVPDKYIYLLVSVPFFILLLCEVLPTWYKNRQIQKLIELGISGKVAQADYFRLQPYEAADYEHFKRADKAHEKVLQWLLAAKAPWLYLTGLSGSGKSSLLQAFVIPELQKQGYRVLVIRSFANPLQALAQELQKPEVIWKNPPKTELPLAQRLQEACSYLKKEKLLLVFDQFEEFVILQNDTAHQALQVFLTELDSALPANLSFLAVVRTDYMGKLSELTLPERFEFKQSAWFDVSPFSLADARQFLQDSGLNLNAQLCEKVLAEAAELEESRGLIRPITLNILGVVLAWFSGGGSLKKVQAGQLIRAYLQEALNETSGFAPPLVAKLLSDAGTKLPRSEADLMAMTALSKGVVRGCLIHLSGKGLVRELDKGVWEISHDFIARLLSGLVWRWRLKWWKRLLPVLSYAGLALWLLAVVVGYPAYQDWDYGRGRALLANYGIEYLPQKDNPKFFEVTIRDKNFEKIPDDIWQILEKNGKEIVSLKIYWNENLSQMPTLDKLTALQSLQISHNAKLSQLPALDKLTALQSLEISYNFELNQLPALDKLPHLIIALIWQKQGLNDLQLHKPVSLKKLFLFWDNETSKAFAESLTQQRQQQGLKSVEIELTNDYDDFKDELKKLKQP